MLVLYIYNNDNIQNTSLCYDVKEYQLEKIVTMLFYIYTHTHVIILF